MRSRPGGEQYRRGPGPSGRGPAGKRPDPLAARVAELQRTTGVPAEVARLVAQGRLDLNEALKRMAFVDQVNATMARHGLDRALATQVALGHADLERVLRKRRVDEHLDAHRDRDAFAGALASGREQVFGLHGRALVHGRVLADEPYEIELFDLESQAATRLHKTQVKFVCDAGVWPKARKAMTWDSVRKARAVTPILRPQQRFGCSNRRLGEAWDKKGEVVVTLVEGEIFTGTIAWVARWELGLHTKGGDIAILRHALDDFRE